MSAFPAEFNLKTVQAAAASIAEEVAFGGAGAAPQEAVERAVKSPRIAELDAEMEADRAAIIEWHRLNVDDSLSREALVQLYRTAELTGTIDLPLKRAKDYIAAHREKAAERARLLQAILDATSAKLREQVPGYKPLPPAVRCGAAVRLEAPDLRTLLDETTELRRLGEAATLSLPERFADLQRQSAASDARIEGLERSLKPFIESAFFARITGVPLEEMKARFRPAELKTAGFSAADLKAGGFTAAQLKAAGFTGADLRAVGVGLGNRLRAAGYSLAELKAEGFSPGDIKYAGFGKDELEASMTKCSHYNGAICDRCWESGSFWWRAW